MIEKIIDGKKYRLIEIKEQPKNMALFIITMPNVNTWNGRWSGENEILLVEFYQTQSYQI